MRNRKNIFWGIMCIVIAAFIIAGAMGVFGEISFWTLFFTPFLVAWFFSSLMKLSWSGLLFSLAFFAILYDKVLGIENLTPWPVLLAAMFGSIGLNIIFGENKFFKIGKWNGNAEDKHHVSFEYSSEDAPMGEYFTEDDSSFRSSVKFAESTKYVACRNLKEALITNSFGESIIYFDGATLANGRADVNVRCTFGEVVLYIPKEWHVNAAINRSFGECSINGNCAKESENLLVLRGSVSFGEISIYYI